MYDLLCFLAGVALKKGEPMSIETNKAIVRRFAQVWGKGDPSILDDLASADIRVSYPLMPAPAHGIEAFKEVLAVVHSAFPDIDCEVGDLIGRRRSCCGSLDPKWYAPG